MTSVNHFHLLLTSNLLRFDTRVFHALFRFLSFGVPVVRCGEGCHHYILPVDVDDICHSLQDVEVKVGVARDGAVQARLEKRGPLLLQDTGRAAAVILTNPGHPRKHHLTKTHTDEKLHLDSPVTYVNQNGCSTTTSFFLVII